jgi:hypothetical protein
VENERRKKENENGESTREKFSTFRSPLSVCVACGAEARRGNAKFCLVCGKLLREDYQPLDRLRASYRMQGKSIEFKTTEVEPVKDLFEQNKNTMVQAAWACLVYSLVPYLGILFIPFTFFIGGVGYVTAMRRPDLGGRRLAIICIAVSFVILAAQIFLWWLLYVIPELGIQI